MREIKFRAWDKRQDCMVDPSSHFVEFDGSVWFNDPWQGEQDALFDQHDNLILMQFTGVCDKNSVPIYEGDLLYSPKHGKAEVRWRDDGCWMTYQEEFDDVTGMLWPSHIVFSDGFETFEVIGNIYENPELLGDNNG